MPYKWNPLTSELDLVDGAGNVVGAASSTDNAVARFDLTSGKILQDSKLTVDDEGKIQYNTSGLTTAAALTSIFSSSSTNNLGYANGVLRLIDNSMTINATSSQIVGRYFAVDTTGSVVKNDPSITGYLPITYLFNSGGTYRADTNATSALAIRDMVGASNFDRINGGTLTVSEYSSFLSQGSVGAGVTITTLRGMWVTNLPTVSGTITNQIGIDIDAITKATTLAVGLRIGQPTTATTNRALQLTGTGTTVDGGIQFGGTSDTTNIYRSAAGTLKTDGSLAIAPSGKTALALTNTGANTGITLGGDTNLYRSAANNLKTDDALTIAAPTSAGDYTKSLEIGQRLFNVSSSGSQADSYYGVWDTTDNRWEASFTSAIVSPTLFEYNYGGTYKIRSAGVANRTAGDALTFVDSFTVQPTGTIDLGAAGGKTTLQLTSTAADTGITLGGDTNLYRAAASDLRTDSTLRVVGKNFQAMYGQNAQITLGSTVGGSSPASIYFGSASDTNLYRSAADVLATDDDLSLKTAGKGLQIKEGSNAKMGVATLVAGTVTVANTSVTANSRIFLTVQSLGTILLPAAVAVTARTASTSFTITSADVTDTSVVAWHIIEPSA